MSGLKILHCLAVVGLLGTGCGKSGSMLGTPSVAASSTPISPPPSGTPSPQAVQDGKSNAPVGGIEHSNLLTGLTTQPSWDVAGVGYGIGYPSATAFLDPSTIHNTGVSVDVATHVVAVTAANVTLNGYNFAGWTIALTGAPNAQIVNSNFAAPTLLAQPLIAADGNSGNLYVGYSILDGGGDLAATEASLISTTGAGLTVEYCWLKNAPISMIDAEGGGQVSVRFNLIENAGQKTGSAAMDVKIGSGSYSAVQVIYNMLNQTLQASSVEGINLSAAGNSISYFEVGDNTMLSLGLNAVSFFVEVLPAQISGSGSVYDNYAGLAGATGFASTGSSGAKSLFMSNVSMSSGSALPTNP